MNPIYVEKLPKDVILHFDVKEVSIFDVDSYLEETFGEDVGWLTKTLEKTHIAIAERKEILSKPLLTAKVNNLIKINSKDSLELVRSNRHELRFYTDDYEVFDSLYKIAKESEEPTPEFYRILKEDVLEEEYQITFGIFPNTEEYRDIHNCFTEVFVGYVEDILLDEDRYLKQLKGFELLAEDTGIMVIPNFAPLDLNNFNWDKAELTDDSVIDLFKFIKLLIKGVENGDLVILENK